MTRIPENQDLSFRNSTRVSLSAFLICCAIVAIMLWAFWPLTHCGFINYDDPDYVTENPHIQAGLTWATVKWAFASMDASNWHPITWLSHALDWQVFGGNAAAHHLMSLAIHLINSLLVFLVLLRLTGATWRPAAVAALFAVHPAHVESVAWISERKDVLSTFFGFLTLLAYANYVSSVRCQGKEKFEIRDSKLESNPKSPPASDCGAARETPNKPLRGSPSGVVRSSRFKVQGSKFFYCVSLVFFALGLMCKPMLVTLPFVMLLLDWWPLNRIERGCDARTRLSALRCALIPGYKPEDLLEALDARR